MEGKSTLLGSSFRVNVPISRKEKQVKKATNKATTATSKKVSVAKLSECVRAHENATEHEASALAEWVTVIGRHVAEDTTRGLAAAFCERTGAKPARVSKAKKVWLAHVESEAEGDDEFSWEDYTNLDDAYQAANAYVGKRETSRPKAVAKPSGKMTANGVIASLGKAEAKKLALAILASL